MQFANIKANSPELHIMWDRTAVSVPINMDVDKKSHGADQHARDDRIIALMFQSAMYYLESGKDMNRRHCRLDKA
jgi:hypothetical protein